MCGRCTGHGFAGTERLLTAESSGGVAMRASPARSLAGDGEAGAGHEREQAHEAVEKRLRTGGAGSTLLMRMKTARWARSRSLMGQRSVLAKRRARGEGSGGALSLGWRLMTSRLGWA